MIFVVGRGLAVTRRWRPEARLGIERPVESQVLSVCAVERRMIRAASMRDLPESDVMLFRLIAGAGLFVIGYYLGREVERYAPMRRELREARENGGTEEIRDADVPGPGDASSNPKSPLGHRKG